MAAKAKSAKSEPTPPVKANSKPASAKPKTAKAALKTPAVKAGGKKPANPQAVAKVKAAKSSPIDAVGLVGAAAASEGGYHVVELAVGQHIAGGAPKKGSKAVPCTSFEEAKDHAIDHLIALIEEAEHRLHSLRRSANLDDYERSLKLFPDRAPG